jgi:hypothetical protein
MFFTTAAATPRNVVVVSPSPSASCAARAAFAAFAATMSSGVAVVVGRAGRATGGAVSVASLPPARGVGSDRVLAETGRDRRGGGGGGGGAAGWPVDEFEGTVDTFGSFARDADGTTEAEAVAISAVAGLLDPVCAKKSRQVESTLPGSARNS